MGIRLNILDDPTVLAGLNPGVPGTAAAMPPANRIGAETSEAQGSPLQRVETDMPNGPGPLIAPDRTDESGSVLRDQRDQQAARPEASAEANRFGELDGALSPSVRDFRFLRAAESARESDLQNRQKQLERRLESTNERLQVAGSTITRIDARLERARLEADLEMIAGEMRRFRLQRVFAQSSASPNAVESAQAARQAAQSPDAVSPETASGPNRLPTLNLLA